VFSPQLKQKEELANDEYLPRGQEKHSSAPERAISPTEHSLQVELPVIGL
jgi:hypothetical protein